MKSILEKAIVHLLNEEHEKAEALFHKFMVERARQIHESLRQGEEVALNEGWDDEITSEEYFTEADLADAEDAEGEADLGAEGGDAAADDLAGDLTGDEAGEGDEFAAGDAEGDVDGDVDADADLGAEGEGDVETRLTDIEDEIEKLSSEFEALMAEFDGDEAVDGEGDEFAADDAEGVEGDDVAGGEGLADQMATDMTDGDAAEDETVHEGDDEFDDLDEITESVIAELEKVAVSLETDGKEVGTGKSFSQNGKSNLPTKKAEHTDAKPFVLKSDRHEGFERETAPAVKTAPKRKNTKTNAEDGRSSVSADGDKSALINKDFAGKPQK